MPIDSIPPTLRSRGQCECAILRHQLSLADALAKAAKPIIDSIRDYPSWPDMRADSTFSNVDQIMLVRAFDVYAEARILIESAKETEDVVRQLIEETEEQSE